MSRNHRGTSISINSAGAGYVEIELTDDQIADLVVELVANSPDDPFAEAGVVMNFSDPVLDELLESEEAKYVDIEAAALLQFPARAHLTAVRS